MTYNPRFSEIGIGQGTQQAPISPFLVNQTGAVTDDMVRTHGEGRQGDGERQGAG